MFDKDTLQRLCETIIVMDEKPLVLRRSPDWAFLGTDGQWYNDPAIPARIFKTMRDLKHEGRKQLQSGIYTAPFQRTDNGDKCLLDTNIII